MSNTTIFSFTEEQLELSQSLQSKIIAKLDECGGRISFAEFMELALYEPELGYYNNSFPKFGKGGDFVTAPTASPLFAKTIGQQLTQLFHNGVKNNLLEIGAGNGQLMLDLLRELGQCIAKYYIFELSPILAEQQKSRLRQHLPHCIEKVVWLDELPVKFDGVILANEVLDAAPCEQVVWHSGNILSRYVKYENNKFVYYELDANKKLFEIANKLPITKELATKYANVAYISEISLNNRAFVQTLAKVLHQGCILIIDYGYAESEYYSINRNHGTIRGFLKQHQLDDVLCYPGLIDITASVDFTAVAVAAIDSGLDLVGYTTQANFLLNCGMLNLLEQSTRDSQYLMQTNQVNYLTSPNEMGDMFKVIGLSKNIEFVDWMGFSVGEKSYTL